MHLGKINHPNPIIDRKVKHFYDHFHYLLSPNSDFISYPHENHLSLLERILFKVSDTTLYPSSVKVIVKYLNGNPLFNTSNDYFSRKEKTKNLLSILKKAQKKVDFNEEFKTALHELIYHFSESGKVDGNSYFKNILNLLVSKLGNDSSIDKLKDHIEYFTTLLLAEFKRAGFSKEELTRFDGVMSRILSKKIHVIDGNEDNFYSEFPLPPEIEIHRGKKGFKEKVEEFILNRTFVQQFEGLYNFFAQERETTFLFRLNNVDDHDSDFFFTYNDVNIYHRDQLIINQSTWEEPFVERFNSFINEPSTCLAEIKLSYKSKKKGTQSAMFKAREAMGFLNYASKKKKEISNGAIFETEYQYAFTNEGESLTSFWQRDKAITSNRSIKQVYDNLYPEKFRPLDINIQKIIKTHDKMLFRASNTGFWDERVNFYWRFIEGVVSHNNENTKGDDIIKKASLILLLNEKQSRMNRLENTIQNALTNSNRKTTGLSIPTNKLSYQLHQFNENGGDFTVFKNLSNYPFIQEKFEEYENIKNGIINYKDTCTFYQTLLWETYAQRNVMFHQNKYCFSTIEKLIDHLPNVVKRLRKTLLDELLDNDGYSITFALENLIEKGKKLRDAQ